MKEIFEFRINHKYATKLFAPSEGRDFGDSVKVIEISKNDPRFFQIPMLDKEISNRFNTGFYFGWNLYHKYTRREVETAFLFNIRLRTVFEPAGAEYGTEYDESSACEICGSNRKQVGPLRLKKSSIPRKDIARTIAGEVIVSERLKECFQNYQLKGIKFEPVLAGNNILLSVYQPKITSPELELTKDTIGGINPFDLSNNSDGEIYKCPEGHTIGLNILSEAFVADSSSIPQYDFFSSKQKFGVNRGLLRPQPLYLCSRGFRQMVLKEKLSGFDFEVARVGV